MVKNAKPKPGTIDELLSIMKDKNLDPLTVQRIAEQVKYPRGKRKELDLSEHIDSEGHIRFGVISDTHLNNRYSRTRDVLPTLYHKFAEMKGSFVLHCGDLSDGPLHGNKQVSEMRYVATTDIINYIVDEFPKKEGLKTYFIGGNEDEKFISKGPKKGRTDICQEIATRRQDMIYLGMTEADIRLGKNTRLMMLHPRPGMGARKPYAISYPAQKILDVITGGEKPEILCLGFYHRVFHFDWRGVDTYFVGTTQNQTPDMLAHLVGADMASWFLDVKIDKKGKIEQLSRTVLPFYK